MSYVDRPVGYSPRFLTYVLIHGIDTFFQKLRTTVSTKMPPNDIMCIAIAIAIAIAYSPEIGGDTE